MLLPWLVMCAAAAGAVVIVVVPGIFKLWNLLDAKVERAMGFPLGVLIGMGTIGTIMLTPQITWLIITSIWYRIRTTTQNVLGHFHAIKNRA
jgi:hypothetical protein